MIKPLNGKKTTPAKKQTNENVSVGGGSGGGSSSAKPGASAPIETIEDWDMITKTIFYGMENQEEEDEEDDEDGLGFNVRSPPGAHRSDNFNTGELDPYAMHKPFNERKSSLGVVGSGSSGRDTPTNSEFLSFNYSNLINSSFNTASSNSSSFMSPPPGLGFSSLNEFSSPASDRELAREMAISASMKTSTNLIGQESGMMSFDLEPSSTSDDISSSSLSSQQQSLSSSSQQQQTTTTATTGAGSGSGLVELLEDDIIDWRDKLCSLYEQFALVHGCQCEPSSNTYTMREGKLNKPLQRKLLTLDQILRSYHQVVLSDRFTGLNNNNSNKKIDSTTSYREIVDVFGDDTRALFSYTLKNQDYKNKLFRLLRSICERVLIYDVSLCDQYHYQMQQQQEQQNAALMSGFGGGGGGMDMSSGESSISSGLGGGSGTTTTSSSVAANPLKVLWNEMRSRSCQFLGPQVQEDVLNLVLRALSEREGFTRLSRRVLVLYVVHVLKKDYPKVSKTSIGHVIQLLYRAGCFKVEKRDNDASLMELKREFMKYESLRRQHDTQIIQIGLESGIRMTPEKWSQTLYGDSAHKSEMQSIIDKLQSMNTIERLIEDFYEKLEMYSLDGLSPALVKARDDFDYIAGINFEKKQQQTNNSRSGGGGSGGGDDDTTTNDTSVDSSRPFEEEQSDELEMLSEKEGQQLQQQQQQQQPQQQPPQVRIIWTLLLECLKCTLSILHAHVDFSSRIMTLIITNQNMMASAQSSVGNLPLINSNKNNNNNLGGGNNNMMGSYNSNNNNNSKQWSSSSSMRQGSHHQQSPIQPPNNRSFYNNNNNNSNNNNNNNNNSNSRMPYVNKFENHPPHHMQQLRDVQLIGMGPNWRQQQTSSAGGYRNTSSSSSSGSSYRSRNTPDSGFSSPYTPGKPSANSYQGGPLQYRQFGGGGGGGMPGVNNNNNDGLDPSDLLYMPSQSQSTVRIPFNSSGSFGQKDQKFFSQNQNQYSYGSGGSKSSSWRQQQQKQ